jgi:hypothetical protein
MTKVIVVALWVILLATNGLSREIKPPEIDETNATLVNWQLP